MSCCNSAQDRQDSAQERDGHLSHLCECIAVRLWNCVCSSYIYKTNCELGHPLSPLPVSTSARETKQSPLSAACRHHAHTHHLSTSAREPSLHTTHHVSTSVQPAITTRTLTSSALPPLSHHYIALTTSAPLCSPPLRTQLAAAL